MAMSGGAWRERRAEAGQSRGRGARGGGMALTMPHGGVSAAARALAGAAGAAGPDAAADEQAHALPKELRRARAARAQPSQAAQTARAQPSQAAQTGAEQSKRSTGAACDAHVLRRSAGLARHGACAHMTRVAGCARLRRTAPAELRRSRATPRGAARCLSAPPQTSRAMSSMPKLHQNVKEPAAARSRTARAAHARRQPSAAWAPALPRARGQAPLERSMCHHMKQTVPELRCPMALT